MLTLIGEQLPTWEGRCCLLSCQPFQILSLGVCPSWWKICWKPSQESALSPYPLSLGGISSPPSSGPPHYPPIPGNSPRAPGSHSGVPGAGRLFITECTEPVCECFAKCLIQGVPSIKLVQTSVSHIHLHLHSVPFITARNWKAP